MSGRILSRHQTESAGRPGATVQPEHSARLRPWILGRDGGGGGELVENGQPALKS